jgi:hypothetical protein
MHGRAYSRQSRPLQALARTDQPPFDRCDDPSGFIRMTLKQLAEQFRRRQLMK